MQIVKVGREAKTLNGALNVLLYVRRGVGDRAVSENIEPAFRSDYRVESVSVQRESRREKETQGPNILKILSRTLCFRMKSPRSFSLTPAWYTT